MGGLTLKATIAGLDRYWLDAVSAVIVSIVVITSLAVFFSNDLAAYLEANLQTVPGSIYTIIVVLFLGAILLGLPSRTSARNVICLSWVFYIPSVLYFSRFDLFSVLVTSGFELFSSHLPMPVIFAAGLILIGGTLARGSVAEMKDIRSSLISRGAITGEVDIAVSRNLVLVALAILVSLGMTVVVSLVVTITTPAFAKPLTGGYWYLVYVLAGAALIAVILVTYLWSRKGR